MASAAAVPDRAAAELWSGVDRLIDAHGDLRDLEAHRLHLLAARRLRERGLAVPDDLHDDERAAAIQALTTPLALERVRAAFDGPIVLLKGPELAARYPDPVLRPSTDVDILVLDAEHAQRSLLDAGFLPLGDDDDASYRTAHHLRPLVEPHLGVKVEVHRRPEWVKWTGAPTAEELVALAEPSRVDVDGLSALPAAYHAAVLAAHSWSTLPLRRLLDLVDLEVLLLETDRPAVTAAAGRWGVDRVVATMIAAADSVILGAPRSWPLRTWASDVAAAREATVFRTHVRRLAGPFWALPPHRAARVAGRVLVHEVLPAPGESWGEKLRRVGLALGSPFRRRSEHERRLPR